MYIGTMDLSTEAKCLEIAQTSILSKCLEIAQAFILRSLVSMAPVGSADLAERRSQ